MALLPHMTIHFLLSLVAGFLVWKKMGKILPSFLGAILGGLAVDTDHLIDYFLAFGRNFQLDYFLSGFQFLKSGKIYVLFHAWEYVVILIILTVIVKNNWIKIFLFSLALGLFFHLSADSILNEGMRPQAYSILYRIEKGFEVEKIVTEEHFQKYEEQKELIKPETL